MSPSRVLPRLLAASCLGLMALTSASLAQQQPAAEYEPRVGQRGKDVVWVPTPQTVVDQMLKMAKVTAADYVVDLGSGDGRTVITAAKLGAKAMGVEFNPDMAELSKRNAQKAGVGDKAQFVNGDIFQTDFTQATVVTMFLLPGLNLRLRPQLLDMKPGTRVVSNTFTMAEWQPDDTATITDDCISYCRAMLWIVPAKANGTWRIGDSDLTIEQEFQFFRGRLATGNVVAPISDGKLVADQISFTAGDTQYTGWVRGDTMEGTARKGGTDTKWQATRK